MLQLLLDKTNIENLERMMAISNEGEPREVRRRSGPRCTTIINVRRRLAAHIVSRTQFFMQPEQGDSRKEDFRLLQFRGVSRS
jgi:hypothetical protein